MNPTVLVPGKSRYKPSDLSLHAVNPIGFAPGKGYQPSDFSLYAPMSVESKPKSLPTKLDLSGIPTFVPGNAMGSEELVWSPTSGTRRRRPDEVYQQSTRAPLVPPATPMQFGQENSSNFSSEYSPKPQYPSHGKRGFSYSQIHSPAKGHRPSDSMTMTTPPQFMSTQSPLNPSTARPPPSNENTRSRPRRGNNSNSIDRMMEMTTLSHDSAGRYAPSSHGDATAYPVNDPSRMFSPSQFRGPRFPSSQARGVYGAEPFSAPPSIPGFGDLHQTGQGMYGGPPSPFHSQIGSFQSRPDASSFHPFPDQGMHGGPSSSFQDQPGPLQSTPDASSFPSQQPVSEIWPNHSSRPHRGALPTQSPNQFIQPTSQTITQPQYPPQISHHQHQTDTLIVPPPGSMLPLDYWNMLHRRESEILTRLDHANRPMTDQERTYISLLAEARVNAAATQIPPRGNLSRSRWLEKLRGTLTGIWRLDVGQTGFPPLIVARKSDFERAVRRELEVVEQGRGGGGVGRGVGGSAERRFGGVTERVFGV